MPCGRGRAVLTHAQGSHPQRGHERHEGGGQPSPEVLPLPPVPQFSSSVPSMQSASASQRQRMGMQCPFLHWNWSNSQRGVQSFCRGRARDSGQQGQTQAVTASPSPAPGPPQPLVPAAHRRAGGRGGRCGCPWGGAGC
uniref:Uncharacterized protein n=1 Tax=Calidris pygmaea TaxID=425635 RepID=A0A8C3JLS5_9CHAR